MIDNPDHSSVHGRRETRHPSVIQGGDSDSVLQFAEGLSEVDPIIRIFRTFGEN